MTPYDKGMGALQEAISPEEITRLGWNLLQEDLSLPTAVLYESRMQHNIRWMQQFVAAYGVKLAPHGKTTMAPTLFRRQIEAGAWGITLATAPQTRAAYEHGVRRVLMANQLVGKANQTIIAHLLQDPEFEFYCLVDSVEQVHQLGAFYANTGQRLNVLLELGVTGGRAGVRNDAQMQDVLEAIAHWSDRSLILSGVELYEGVLTEEAAVRAFLERAVTIVRRLLEEEQRFARSPVLLSGAGSAWYDVVAEIFSGEGWGDAVEIVLRPGCYLTHDVGLYREAQEKIQQRNPIAQQMHSGLRPALQVWAYVQSRPEPEKVIVGLGKRDTAFDAGLPMPVLCFRPGEKAPKAALAGWTLTKMMDQHAFLQVASEDDLRVGDMIGFDISHPCLTFDRWRWLPVLDDSYTVIDVVETFF
jgi:D-serine dehydratase